MLLVSATTHLIHLLLIWSAVVWLDLVVMEKVLLLVLVERLLLVRMVLWMLLLLISNWGLMHVYVVVALTAIANLIAVVLEHIVVVRWRLWDSRIDQIVWARLLLIHVVVLIGIVASVLLWDQIVRGGCWRCHIRPISTMLRLRMLVVSSADRCLVQVGGLGRRLLLDLLSTGYWCLVLVRLLLLSRGLLMIDISWVSGLANLLLVLGASCGFI